MTIPLTTKTLKKIAGLNGFTGVAELAREIGCHRVTLYSALRQPDRYGPTVKKLNKQLLRRRH